MYVCFPLIYLVLQILFQVMSIHVVNGFASLACWSASSVFLVSAYSMAEDSTPWCRKFDHPCLVFFLPLCFWGWNEHHYGARSPWVVFGPSTPAGGGALTFPQNISDIVVGHVASCGSRLCGVTRCRLGSRDASLSRVMPPGVA